MSSSQLMKSYIFQRGRSTTNYIDIQATSIDYQPFIVDFPTKKWWCSIGRTLVLSIYGLEKASGGMLRAWAQRSEWMLGGFVARPKISEDCYPLVNSHITNWKITFFWGGKSVNPLFYLGHVLCRFLYVYQSFFFNMQLRNVEHEPNDGYYYDVIFYSVFFMPQFNVDHHLAHWIGNVRFQGNNWPCRKALHWMGKTMVSR